MLPSLDRADLAPLRPPPPPPPPEAEAAAGNFAAAVAKARARRDAADEGDTARADEAPHQAASHDTPTGIAERHAQPTATLIADNSQFRDPDLIHPGDVAFAAAISPEQKDTALLLYNAHAADRAVADSKHDPAAAKTELPDLRAEAASRWAALRSGVEGELRAAGGDTAFPEDRMRAHLAEMTARTPDDPRFTQAVGEAGTALEAEWRSQGVTHDQLDPLFQKDQDLAAARADLDQARHSTNPAKRADVADAQAAFSEKATALHQAVQDQLDAAGRAGPPEEREARIAVRAATMQEYGPQDAGFQDTVDQAKHASVVQPGMNAVRQAYDTSGTIDPVRAGKVDDWVDHHSDPTNGSFLGIPNLFDHHSSAEKVKSALIGRSELGELSADEQRYLMDGMLDRWADGKGEGTNSPGELARSLPDNPGLREVVAERTALRACVLADRPLPQDGLKRYQMRTETEAYARAAVEAASGSVGCPPGDLAPLRDMVGQLGPKGAALFAHALDPNPNDLLPPGEVAYGAGGSETPAQVNAELLGRTLAALNGGPRTDATSAFVQNAFALATPSAYLLSVTPQPSTGEPRGLAGVPDMREQMATALAREWHPENPDAAAADTRRLHDILGTQKGLDLLAARPDGPPLDIRANALDLLRLRPEITADTLRATSDPWTNRAITGPMAQAQAAPFLARGDAPQVLSGSDLPNTVGVAMGQEAKTPPGMTPEAAEAALAQGQANYFQGNDQVRTVSDAIREVGGDDARVTVLPVTYSNNETGPVRLPLFRVETSAGERFVDNQGAIYHSFDHWRTTNALPPGSMDYPEGGHLTAGPDGQVRLGHANTPKTVDTVGEHVEQVFDKAALVGAVVVTGLVIVGTDGLAVPVINAATFAWGARREVEGVRDRVDHGQTLSLADPEARDIWLGLAADTTSLGTLGTTAHLAQLGRAGKTVSSSEVLAHSLVRAGANLTHAAVIANQGVDLAQEWSSMTPQDRARAVLQFGFWNAAGVAGARASGTKPGEMYNPVSIRDNLLQAYAPLAGKSGAGGAEPGAEWRQKAAEMQAASRERWGFPEGAHMQFGATELSEAERATQAGGTAAHGAEGAVEEGVPAAAAKVESFNNLEDFNRACNHAEPNTEYCYGTYTWKTDQQGRVSSVEGQVQLGKNGRIATDGVDTRSIGKSADAKPGDVGFHLIAERFEGPVNRLNVVPGNGVSVGNLKNLNLSGYKIWEYRIASLAREPGNTVDIKIDLHYNTLNDTTRPDAFYARYQVNGGGWNGNDYVFRNRAGG